MQLKEFIDKNGNQVKIPKTNKTSMGITSSAGFKKRFEKLLEYATKHRFSKINKVEVTKLTEDTLEFAEHYDGGAIVDYKIYIGASTEAWHVEIFTTIINAKDREKVEDIVGTGWVELLKALRIYIMVPVVGTPEYKNLLQENLLKEFVDAKGNKVVLNKTSSKATGNIPDQTKRFESLVAQIQADNICVYEINSLTNQTLDLTINYKIPMHIERIRSSYPYILTIGNNKDAYADFEEVLYELIEEGIIANTDLCESANLKEFVDKNGNQVKIPRASSTAPKVSKTSMEYKFATLLYAMMKDKLPSVTDCKCENVSDTGFTYKEKHSTNIGDYELVLEVSYNNNSWKYDLYIDDSLVETRQGDGMKELLNWLSSYFSVPRRNTKEYEELCESASLQEFVDKNGNKVTLSKLSSKAQAVSNTSIKTNKEKFRELTNYMINNPASDIGDKVINAEVTKIDNDGFTYREIHQLPANKYELTLVVNYSKNNPSDLPWQFTIYKNGRHLNTYVADPGDGWEEFLEALQDNYNVPVHGSQKYKYICESTSSIAEDFKLYESLWD